LAITRLYATPLAAMPPPEARASPFIYAQMLFQIFRHYAPLLLPALRRCPLPLPDMRVCYYCF